MRETGRNLVTAPVGEPVLREEAKAHLRVDGSEQDPWIDSAIVAARRMVEKWTWRALMPQTWDIYYDDFPVGGEPFRLPLPPLTSITSISYVDTEGDSQTLSSSLYQVNEYAEPAVVRAAYNTEWPEVRDETLKAVTVRAVCGYADIANVPAEYKHAILLLLGHWHENREAVVVGTISTELEMTVQALVGTDNVRAMIA